MNEPTKISLCVITLNEERNLEACLASAEWADEKVVVDSGSRDGTLAIAERFGCRVIGQEFLGHVKQKDLAVRSASHDWVLCLDADERPEPGAEAEIRRALSEGGDGAIRGYSFPRHTYYLKGWINHGGWWPEYRLRLFHRGHGAWTGTDPHDRVEVDGPTARLKSEIFHYNYRDLAHHMEKVNAYTSIMADRRVRAGQKPSFARMLLNPPARFLRMFVLKRGFLDGKRGFVIAVIGAFYVFLKYAKIWESRLPDQDQQSRNPRFKS